MSNHERFIQSSEFPDSGEVREWIEFGLGNSEVIGDYFSELNTNSRLKERRVIEHGLEMVEYCKQLSDKESQQRASLFLTDAFNFYSRKCLGRQDYSLLEGKLVDFIVEHGGESESGVLAIAIKENRLRRNFEKSANFIFEHGNQNIATDIYFAFKSENDNFWRFINDTDGEEDRFVAFIIKNDIGPNHRGLFTSFVCPGDISLNLISDSNFLNSKNTRNVWSFCKNALENNEELFDHLIKKIINNDFCGEAQLMILEYLQKNIPDEYYKELLKLAEENESEKRKTKKRSCSVPFHDDDNIPF